MPPQMWRHATSIVPYDFPPIMPPPIIPFGSLFTLVIWVMGVLNAINGEQKELPIVGKYADQLLKF